MHSKKRICFCILVFILFFSCEIEALTLDNAVRYALQNHHAIKKEEQLIKSWQAQKNAYKKEFFPVLSANYSYVRLGKQPYSKKGGMYTGDRDKYEMDVTLTGPLFTGFYLLSQYKWADINVEKEEVLRELAQLNVETKTKIAYFNILYQKRILETKKEAVNQLKAHLKDAEKFYENGLIPLNDLLKSKVSYVNALEEKRKAESAYVVSHAELEKLMGKKITEKLTDTVNYRTFSLPERLLFQWAEQKRPELKALKLSIKKSKYAIKMKGSDYYPHISYFTKYARSGYNPTASKNRYEYNSIWSGGINLSWDVFEWGKTRNEVQSEEAKKLSQQEAYLDLLGEIKVDVKRAYENIAVSLGNIELAKVALKQAKENYRITDLQYKEQVTTSTEVLDARTLLSQSEANYYGALYGYFDALARLERTVGKRDIVNKFIIW
ncbi:MAG: TolC family protein [Deltaproteobacteria bacterium]|nr:TolC family protein [Deltaproteobacteria bacterium]